MNCGGVYTPVGVTNSVGNLVYYKDSIASFDENISTKLISIQFFRHEFAIIMAYCRQRLSLTFVVVK